MLEQRSRKVKSYGSYDSQTRRKPVTAITPLAVVVVLVIAVVVVVGTGTIVVVAIAVSVVVAVAVSAEKQIVTQCWWLIMKPSHHPGLAASLDWRKCPRLQRGPLYPGNLGSRPGISKNAAFQTFFRTWLWRMGRQCCSTECKLSWSGQLPYGLVMV